MLWSYAEFWRVEGGKGSSLFITEGFSRSLHEYQGNPYLNMKLGGQYELRYKSNGRGGGVPEHVLPE